MFRDRADCPALSLRSHRWPGRSRRPDLPLAMWSEPALVTRPVAISWVCKRGGEEARHRAADDNGTRASLRPSRLMDNFVELFRIADAWAEAMPLSLGPAPSSELRRQKSGRGRLAIQQPADLMPQDQCPSQK